MNEYVIALVYAYLTAHPDAHCSWVRPYSQVRWAPTLSRPVVTRVGGHWRRSAHYANLLSALACTCRFERIGSRVILNTPPTLVTPRYDEEGEYIPRAYRVAVWS